MNSVKLNKKTAREYLNHGTGYQEIQDKITRVPSLRHNFLLMLEELHQEYQAERERIFKKILTGQYSVLYKENTQKNLEHCKQIEKQRIEKLKE